MAHLDVEKCSTLRESILVPGASPSLCTPIGEMYLEVKGGVEVEKAY